MDIEVKDELGGRVRAIVFNRPAKKNAITAAMYGAVARELTEAEAAPRVRAVVLTGAGSAFTAGNDIHDFVASPPLADDSPVLAFLAALARFKKPLLAQVNGIAVGVGTTMLLHCDLVLAAESSRFSLPFVNLGLSAEGGSSLLLPRLMGWARASELLLWGEPFDAARALSWGLVNEVVPDGELGARTEARLLRLLELPPDAVLATKALLRAPLREALDRAMTSEVSVFGERLRSQEAAEAFAAFLEKRKPVFGDPR